MLENIMKAVKRKVKKKSLNVTTAAVVGFLLSCPLTMGEGLEITQEAGEKILFNDKVYDKATHPFVYNTFEDNIYSNNMEIVNNGQLGLAIEIADDLQLEIYNNNLISADNNDEAYGIYNSSSKIKKIENNGTISAKGTNSSSGIYNIYGEIESIVNTGEIIVETTASSQSSYGIYNLSSKIGDIVNDGIISAETKGNNSDGYGIYNRLHNDQGTIKNILNNGLVLGKGIDNGLGIRNTGMINNIKNAGIIYGNSLNQSSGVHNESTGVIKKINNSGKIVGTVGSQARGIYNYSGTIKSIENTGITIYKLFQKKEIKYSEIKYIVISHAVGRTSTVGYLGKFRRCSGGKIRFKPYPWITLCNKISDKITKEVSDTLDRKSVDYLLKKNGFIYSFIWNRYAMEKLLIHPEVNIFISKSIEVRYKREIEELVVKYDIPKDRLHIIKDKVVMHFLWDNEFKKTFPEWNEDDLCV